MRVSYNWLTEYVDIEDIKPHDLADKLTAAGVEVDAVIETGAGIEDVVVGYVRECEQHPNAERLSLCHVELAEGRIEQIICGAPNVAQGQKVAVAQVGAVLPGDFKIKRAKLRGIESCGMICSVTELGFDKKYFSKDVAEGILVLDENELIGDDIRDVLGLNDYILDLALTPNRSDCLSMIGVAYEVAAILDREIRLPEISLDNKIDSSGRVKIELTASDACPHYAARLVTDVKVAESPEWLRNRLIAGGIRPINNLVDITNYVLLEYGQPLHAFDFSAVKDGLIDVRYAKENEILITLDDLERKLDPEMLLITDKEKAIALAGVMGGANSEIVPETTQVLLESAYFNNLSIGRTARKLDLRSEASTRFEKGVDPNRIYAAVNRAAELLAELAGAKIIGDIYEAKVSEPVERKVPLNPDKQNSIIGMEMKNEEMLDIFRRLRFPVKESNEGLIVQVPTRRGDISIEEDLAEELARIYGYENIPTTLPVGPYTRGHLTAKQKLTRRVKNNLEGSGLYEVISYTLVSNKSAKRKNNLYPDLQPIKLLTPLSEQREYLRTQLLENLFEIAEYNANRQMPDVRIFEIGNVFSKIVDETDFPVTERKILAGLLMGELPRYWTGQKDIIDFYYAKGVIEEFFRELGLANIEYIATEVEGYHPGRTAEILYNGRRLGYVGEAHPEFAEEYDLKRVYLFELDYDLITDIATLEIDYKSLPKYPAVERDIAVVVDNETSNHQVTALIQNTARDLLEDLELFDVYSGSQLGEGKKSLAYALTFRSKERTLTDDEISALNLKIIKKLEVQLQAEIRK